MKSTLPNMVLSLAGIAIVAAAALAAVNSCTKSKISEGADTARMEALRAVSPEFDSHNTTTGADGLTVYNLTLGDTPAGTAVETFSDNGFSGRITILAGFDNAGTLTGYRVLQHQETPGLGAPMDTWFMPDAGHGMVVGSNAPLAVKADGGEIDAITGATITSRAFMEAINKARTAIGDER